MAAEAKLMAERQLRALDSAQVESLDAHRLAAMEGLAAAELKLSAVEVSSIASVCFEVTLSLLFERPSRKIA